MDDGALVAPFGQAGSIHCGVCNENLPLRLDGWTVIPIPPPEPPPEPSVCVTCGLVSMSVSGWTVAGQGLLCPKCWEVLRDGTIPATKTEKGGS